MPFKCVRSDTKMEVNKYIPMNIKKKTLTDINSGKE